MAKLIVNVMGEKGQQNFRECLWARRRLNGSVSQISGVLEASGSKENCLRALQHFLDVCTFDSPTEDMEELLVTPDSDEPCNQAFQTMRKSRAVRAEVLRHEFLATTNFGEQYVTFTEKLKAGSLLSQWLDQYSEAGGRHLGQGLGRQTLFVLYFLDNLDPNSVSFTPEMREKAKRWIANARSDGRWLSKLYRQFGPGIFCHATIQTKTA